MIHIHYIKGLKNKQINNKENDLEIHTITREEIKSKPVQRKNGKNLRFYYLLRVNRRVLNCCVDLKCFKEKKEKKQLQLF